MSAGAWFAVAGLALTGVGIFAWRCWLETWTYDPPESGEGPEAIQAHAETMDNDGATVAAPREGVKGNG